MSAQSEEKPKKSEDQIRQDVRKHREFQAAETQDIKKNDSDQIKYQAEHYDEIPLWSSFRGRAVAVFGILVLLMSGYQLYLQEYTVTVFFVLIVYTLLYFIAKGHLWSIFVFMLLVVFHAVSNWIYFGVIEQRSGAWLSLLVGFALLAYLMMPALRVEQKRAVIVKKSEKTRETSKNTLRPKDIVSPVKTTNSIQLVLAVVFGFALVVAAYVLRGHLEYKEHIEHIEWQCLQHISYARDKYYFDAVEGEKAFKNKDDAMEYCLMQFENTGVISHDEEEDVVPVSNAPLNYSGEKEKTALDFIYEEGAGETPEEYKQY
jgi:hypothetical protein